MRRILTFIILTDHYAGLLNCTGERSSMPYDGSWCLLGSNLNVHAWPE